MSTAGTIGEVGGGIAGGGLGAAIGTVLGGPIGGWIGRAVGSRIGRIAGRAAGEALANMMEKADEDAKPIPDTKAEPCKDCGEIKCFNPPEGSTPEEIEEFKRQLQEQQDGINRIAPDQLLSNMEQYAQFGRPAGDAAARSRVRSDYLERRTQELIGPNTSRSAAREMARTEMRTMDALHAPDLAAGGDGTFADRGLGSSSANRSIGPQWDEGRRNQLREHAKKAKEQGKKNNVKLEMCPQKGSKGGKQGSGASGGGTPGGGTGQGSPPVS
jgi:hypothetical protein